MGNDEKDLLCQDCAGQYDRIIANLKAEKKKLEAKLENIGTVLIAMKESNRIIGEGFDTLIDSFRIKE